MGGVRALTLLPNDPWRTARCFTVKVIVCLADPVGRLPPFCGVLSMVRDAPQAGEADAVKMPNRLLPAAKGYI